MQPEKVGWLVADSLVATKFKIAIFFILYVRSWVFNNSLLGEDSLYVFCDLRVFAIL